MTVPTRNRAIKSIQKLIVDATFQFQLTSNQFPGFSQHINKCPAPVQE